METLPHDFWHFFRVKERRVKRINVLEQLDFLAYVMTH